MGRRCRRNRNRGSARCRGTKKRPSAWGPPRNTECPSGVSDVLLSHGLPRSTIGARGLNFRVRNGTGCASPAMVADPRRAFFGSPLGPRPQGRTAWISRRPSPLMTAHETRSSMRVRARPISAARLRRSHALHLPPIYLVVCQGPYRKENSSWDGLPA